MTRDRGTAALQQMLAAEHAAVYAYEAVAGRMAMGSARGRLAVECFAVHRDRRDRLVAVLRSRAVQPVAARPGYLLPKPVGGRAAASAVSRKVEDRCAVVYATVVAATTGADRRLGIDALVDAATRGMAWGSPATAFPGVGPT